MVEHSPDPAADRFLDKLLAESKRVRLKREAEKSGIIGEDAPDVPGLSEAMAEVDVPERLATLLDDSDPVAAIGQFLKDKTLRGV